MKKRNEIIKRALFEYERRRCAESPWYFACKYCRTLDSDDSLNPVKLFPAYPFVKKLWDELASGDDVHIEKSRQMFVSWTVMTYFLHQTLFGDRKQLLAISSKQELVDDGGKNSTPQSLLGKTRFVYDNLPLFLRLNKEGKELLAFSKLRILNLDTGSALKGETSNPNAGRSGNYNNLLIDEAAFVPNSEALFTAARLACKRGIIICSTPNGKGNLHWRIKYGNRDSGFKSVRLHWSEHPERDDSWYEKRRMSMTEEQAARELDINYDLSVAGRIYTEFSYEKHVSHYNLSYDPLLPLYTSWDFGIGDPTAILFLQTDSFGHTYIIDEFQDSDKDTSYYARKVVETVSNWGMTTEEAETLLRDSTHYGDPAGAQRGARLESWISDLRTRAGIHIRTKPGVRKINKINKVKLLLSNAELSISPHCVKLIEAIQNYHRETDRYGRILSERPVHDWSSHFNDALQEYAVNRFPDSQQRFAALRIDI